MPNSLDDAFALAGQLAIAGWLALVFLPRWRGVSAALAGWIVPGLLSLGYFVLIALFWHGAPGGFSSLDSVAALFGSKPLLLAGWVHYLAFDLFLGNWILRRSQDAAIPHWLVVPILIATFLFGPIGYLLFLLARASFQIAADDRIARLQARLPAFLRDLELEPRLTAAGLAMLATAIPTALAYVFDSREFQGVNTWLKPLKFELSVAIYLLTLGLFLPLAGERFRASRLGRFVVMPVIVLIFLEVIYIGWRASRVEASHYNSDSWLGMALYNAMGAAAVLFTLAAGILAYGLARRDAATLAPVLRRSLVTGLGLTSVLGIVSGAVLGASGGHFVGVPAAGSPVVPLFGWSLTSGDLRLAHFLGLHALQIIPAFGLLVWLLTRQARLGMAAVGAFSAAYASLAIVTLVAALRARPLLGLG